MQHAITSPVAVGQRCFHTHAATRWLLAAVCGASTVSAWATGTLYRCAGKPETYTNQSWAAGRADCRAVIGAPLTTARSTARLTPRSSARSAAPARPHLLGAARVSAVAHVSSSADASVLKVTPNVQSLRDQDRKRILEEELGHEQARLATLGDTIKQERSRASAVELAQLSQSSARMESNVQALQRELSRLRP
jgi:hypothetical protein